MYAEDRRQISMDDKEDRAVSRHETYENGRSESVEVLRVLGFVLQAPLPTMLEFLPSSRYRTKD